MTKQTFSWRINYPLPVVTNSLMCAFLLLMGCANVNPKPIQYAEKRVVAPKDEESAGSAQTPQKEKPASLPDTAVGRRGQAFLEFLNKADKSAVEDFVNTHFAKAFADHAPLDIHTEVLAGIWEKHPSPVLRHVYSITDFTAEFYLKSSVNQSWVQISLNVEEESPHKITWLYPSRLDDPPDVVLLDMDPEALTDEQRSKIVARIDTIMRHHYLDPEIGAAAGKYIVEAAQKGEYDDISKLNVFAERLTADLLKITKDKHVKVHHPKPSLENGESKTPPPCECDLAAAKVLPGNIGYIEVRMFLPSKDIIADSMETVEDTAALIFDVRKNPGGAPEGVQSWCSYLFDTKTHLNSLYWREGDRTEEFWTLDEIEGKKRPDVPVFVLTSDQTFSGAEEFAYDLQTRERATIVGQTTAGAAHLAPAFSISPQLKIRVSIGKAVNPVTETNWEGVGVKPDVEVEAERALEKAITLAKRAAKKYRRRNGDGDN